MDFFFFLQWTSPCTKSEGHRKTEQEAQITGILFGVYCLSKAGNIIGATKPVKGGSENNNI